MHVDPVCGMELTSHDVVTSAQYGNETYYFCSEECRRRFEKQPSVYTE